MFELVVLPVEQTDKYWKVVGSNPAHVLDVSGVKAMS